MTDEPEPSEETPRSVVLDFLARGDSDADRPQFRRSPVAYAVNLEDFSLSKLALADDTELSIGDRLTVEGADSHPDVAAVRRVDYEELSGGAQSELEYVVEEVVEDEEDRFVDFYNEAQPITLRLHQLNLLPGIGKKLRNGILDERKRRPFESFGDLEERVSGLHDPQEVLVERILEEIRDDDLKYRNFVAGPEE